MQYYYVYSQKDERLIDFVGRFESINKDFKKICDKIGVNVSLPHKNKSKESEYKKYYNERSKKRVKEIWGKDIDKFSYSF